jgi:alanine dehydrogenase
MLILSRDDVERLIEPEALVAAMAEAMADLSGGRASAPPRIAAEVPGKGGLLLAMPGHVPSADALATKLVSLFPGNAGGAFPTHQAVIVAFDAATGTPVAVMDGTYVTAARTAACSALSARLLARPESHTLAVLGTGVQARAHALALPAVLPIRRILVAGTHAGRAGALAAELGDRLGIEVRAAAGYDDAVAQADVVCATTHPGAEPAVRRHRLRPGTHVASVGFDPSGREVDDATVADALVCVESRAAALSPAPAGSHDLLDPIARGVIGPDHIHAELGELVSGDRPGRPDDGTITLYKSVGVAVQDVAAAALVLAAARERGAGREVPL